MKTSDDQGTPEKVSTRAESDLGPALRITSLLTWQDSRPGKRQRRGGLRDRVVGDGWEAGLLVVGGSSYQLRENRR